MYGGIGPNIPKFPEDCAISALRVSWSRPHGEEPSDSPDLRSMFLPLSHRLVKLDISSLVFSEELVLEVAEVCPRIQELTLGYPERLVTRDPWILLMHYILAAAPFRNLKVLKGWYYEDMTPNPSLACPVQDMPVLGAVHPSLKEFHLLRFGRFECLYTIGWRFFPEKASFRHPKKVPSVEEAIKDTLMRVYLESLPLGFVKKLYFNVFGGGKLKGKAIKAFEYPL
ncbi:hypothetical protein M422DRAFT_264632 [Sphaerobolus stellatus SS14]|uniref:Uncharacterized protein n=1 Tax=Sphaerobolus stellatus (strain SS14) TaxID=990650 RepID=A0A0C9V7Q5_SPHS4|nr:hypothetical protein M422DRAFT_264632 [Sphaerobolus stellatus SS14]